MWLKSCPTLATPWTVACQVPLSMGFSRQEYWSGLPFSSPGDLLDPEIEPGSPALQADSLLTKLWWKKLYYSENPLFLKFRFMILPVSQPEMNVCLIFFHCFFPHLSWIEWANEGYSEEEWDLCYWSDWGRFADLGKDISDFV